MPTTDMERGSSKEDAKVHVVSENEADELARADQAIPEGTRICVTGSGRGAYVSFGKKTFGANEHTIAFDSGETAAVKLKQEEWTVKEAEMDAMDPPRPLRITVTTIMGERTELEVQSSVRSNGWFRG